MAQRVLVTEPIAEEGLEALRRGAEVDVRLGISKTTCSPRSAATKGWSYAAAPRSTPK